MMRKRTVPVLDHAQEKTFIELVARGASVGEFTLKLNLGPIDIDSVAKKLGVETPEQARAKLAVLAGEESVREAKRANMREEERRRHREAESRLEAAQAVQAAKDAADLAKREKKASATTAKVKKDDAKRQKRHEVNKKKASGDLLDSYRVPSKFYVGASIKTKKKPSSIPAEIGPTEFRNLLMNKGRRFVCDLYNINEHQLRLEIDRLNLNIQIELLPR
jgi:hypothetical protein